MTKRHRPAKTNNSIGICSCIAATMLPGIASAQDITDPPGALTVSGDVTLVSDYRFRGVSRTDRRPALQGSATIEHASGFYGTVWASTVSDYIFNGADAEIDVSAGYRTTSDGTTIDVGVLYYLHPGSDGIASDFVEPYASVAHILGPVTAQASLAYAPRQAALSVGNGREDNLYVAGDLSAGIPGTPFAMSAHIGRTFGPSRLSIGRAYTDWRLGATYTTQGLTFGLAYVDTDDAFITPRGRNEAGAGAVASVGLSF